MRSETMSPVATEATQSRQATWAHLFSLAKKEADDHQALGRELGDWCEARAAQAALYTKTKGVFQRLSSHGSTRFPDEIVEGSVSTLDSSLVSVELPQVMLLHTSLDEDPEPSEAILLLAAGARISSLKQQIQEQRFQAKFRGVELEALYDVGLAIGSTLDLEELCEEALVRAVSLLDARRGALYLLDFGPASGLDSGLDSGIYRLTSRFGGDALQSFEANEEQMAALVAGEGGAPEGWLPGACHLLAVPVAIGTDARGVLVVADKESRTGVGPFPETDRRTLSLFANQAAIALENAKLHKLALEKERLEREMELAAEIQQQLLPKTMPTIPGYEVIGWNRPARQAGGDYYDFHPLDHGNWELVVGDVVGKGVPAALLVSTLHSALRVLLDQMEVGPPLLERLNRHIFESSSANKFITMLLAVLDTRRHELAYLNAGHNPGLLVRASGETIEMHSAGMPLGLMQSGQFGASTLELEPDDLVCVYSDGITECEEPGEEEFGLERLRDLLIEHRESSLPEILHRIDKSVTDFAQGQPQGDDQTVVLLRRS